MRHAQSEWNAVGRWQGWADPPLTPLGREQAARAGRRLPEVTRALREDRIGPVPQAVVSSDLQRAVTTAAIIVSIGLPDAVVEVDTDLREYRVGAWSGLTRVQIEGQWPGLLDRWDHGDLTTPPGGEDREHFETRLFSALDRVAAAVGLEGTGLVVSHGGAIRAVGRRLDAPFERVGNLAGLIIDGADGRYARIDDLSLLAPIRRAPEPTV